MQLGKSKCLQKPFSTRGMKCAKIPTRATANTVSLRAYGCHLNCFRQIHARPWLHLLCTRFDHRLLFSLLFSQLFSFFPSPLSLLFSSPLFLSLLSLSLSFSLSLCPLSLSLSLCLFLSVSVSLLSRSLFTLFLSANLKYNWPCLWRLLGIIYGPSTPYFH